MTRAIVSIGSNIEPEANVRRTMEIMHDRCHSVVGSDFIVTEPDGYKDQADFLNGAVGVETSLTRAEFQKFLKDTEKQLGRVKGPIKAGPRTIDLDLIIWDGQVVHDDYPTKDYTRIPVDQVLAKLNLPIPEQAQ